MIFVLIGINLLCAANLHGKVKTGKCSFWETLFNGIITLILMLWSWSWVL